MLKNYTLVIILVALLLSLLLSNVEHSHLDRDLLFSNLIVVSGIIAGIIIAYIATKVFEIRSDRISRNRDINHLFDKITSFRKICFYIIQSNELWENYKDISDFKKKYAQFRYTNIHSHNDETGQFDSFWNSNFPYHSATIDLYLALKEIIGEPKAETWWTDPIYSESYTLSDIERMYDPSNQIWYYLVGRYPKHLGNKFKESGIGKLFEDYFYKELNNINEKYNSYSNIRTLMGGLGADFYSIYLPKTYELMKLNIKPMPIQFSLFVIILLMIIIFGIILPLIHFWVFHSIVSDFILVLSFSFVATCILSLFAVLISFIKNEVTVGKYT